MANLYSTVYMYHNFFMHSSVGGHLGCFHVLGIVNSAAMNIGAHVSFSMYIFLNYSFIGVYAQDWDCWIIQFSSVQFSSVQLLSRVQLFVTTWTAAHQASLSITSSQSSLKLTSIKSGMPSSHLILCRPLLLLPPIPPSIRVFAWGGQSIGVSSLA